MKFRSNYLQKLVINMVTAYTTSCIGFCITLISTKVTYVSSGNATDMTKLHDDLLYGYRQYVRPGRDYNKELQIGTHILSTFAIYHLTFSKVHVRMVSYFFNKSFSQNEPMQINKLALVIYS